MHYLVDTDILIDFFRKNEPAIDYLDGVRDPLPPTEKADDFERAF